MELTTEARNTDGARLVEILKDQRTRRLDVIAPATAMEATDEGQWAIMGTVQDLTEEGVTSAAGLYSPTASADSGLAAKLKIPGQYLAQLRVSRPDTYAKLINSLIQGGGAVMGDDGPQLAYPASTDKYMFRLLRGDTAATGVARAVLSDKYLPIENLDILVATLDGVSKAGVQATIDRCDLSDHRMYVTMVAPAVTAKAEELLKNYRNPFGDEFTRWAAIAEREGMGYGGDEPIVYGGFKFSNSETGNGSYRLEPVAIVRVCKNGLTIKMKAAKRQVHRGARQDEGILEYSADTLAKQLALITAKTRDSVAQWMTSGWLQGVVDDLTAQAGVPIADPVSVVHEVVRQSAIPTHLEEDILSRFILGGQITAGGVMQAVSAQAQLVTGADLASELEDLAIPAMQLAARIAS